MVWTPSAYTSLTERAGASPPSAAAPFQTALSASRSSALELSRALRNLCTSGCSATSPPVGSSRSGSGADHIATRSARGPASGVEHGHHAGLPEQTELLSAGAPKYEPRRVEGTSRRPDLTRSHAP